MPATSTGFGAASVPATIDRGERGEGGSAGGPPASTSAAAPLKRSAADAFDDSSSDDEDDVLSFEGTVPAHFYGEMAKTELGCQVLADKGHFIEFAEFIRQHGLEHEDLEIIDKLKSVLWAVGNIGATARGLHFLEDQEIIPEFDVDKLGIILGGRGNLDRGLG